MTGDYIDPSKDYFHKHRWIKVYNISTKVKPYLECYCGKKKLREPME